MNDTITITFDCTPPDGVPWHAHRAGVLEALYIARTTLVVERSDLAAAPVAVRAGLNFMSMVRLLPGFRDYALDMFRFIEDVALVEANNAFMSILGDRATARVVLMSYPVTLRNRPDLPPLDVLAPGSRRFSLDE